MFDLLEGMERTKYCGEFTDEYLSKSVVAIDRKSVV